MRPGYFQAQPLVLTPLKRYRHCASIAMKLTVPENALGICRQGLTRSSRGDSISLDRGFQLIGGRPAPQRLQTPGGRARSLN